MTEILPYLCFIHVITEFSVLCRFNYTVIMVMEGMIHKIIMDGLFIISLHDHSFIGACIFPHLENPLTFVVTLASTSANSWYPLAYHSW